MARLDRIDYRILHNLQAKGRITNCDLAELVCLSAPPTLRRTQWLEAEKFITGYTANLNARKLGFHVIAFISVTLARHDEKAIQAFRLHLQDIEEVRECHAVMGDYDFALKIATTDAEAFKLLVAAVEAHENVADLKIATVARTLKDEKGLPLKSHLS